MVGRDAVKAQIVSICGQVKKHGEPNILACGNLKRYNRILLAKLLCGILPLEVETGRYAKKWDDEKR